MKYCLITLAILFVVPFSPVFSKNASSASSVVTKIDGYTTKQDTPKRIPAIKQDTSKKRPQTGMQGPKPLGGKTKPNILKPALETDPLGNSGDLSHLPARTKDTTKKKPKN